MKTSNGKNRLKEFLTTTLALQRILERILHYPEEDKHSQEVTGNKQCQKSS